MSSFSLPLRPVRKHHEKKDDLPLRIAQINAQRGGFRNVTEAGLQAEIDALRAAGRNPNDPEEALDEKKGDVETNRQEELFKSRAEILDFAMQAHAEATFALDFVSLLSSKHNPRQAELSMSPYLKAKAPLGSLGIDVTRTPERSAGEQTDIDTVSRGWKMESFRSAADKLLRSAERLEETVAAETQYWSEVLAVKDKGWKVCRLPREKQTLGVQFGFMEATSTFRDRGMAALRKGDGGSLVLDQGIRATAPRAVRVRVQQGDRTVGLSIPKPVDSKDTTAVEADIRRARDGLFEEELFYELYREARSLIKHGVDVKRDLILFPADDRRRILIDLVDPDTISNESTSEEDVLAESISQSFRILLSHAHRNNLRRRSIIPPPVTVNPRPNPEYILLRPTVSYLDHKSHFQWLKHFLETLTKTLRAAGLHSTPNTFPLTSRPPADNSIESFVNSLITPLESYITFPLCTPSTGFRIRIHTSMHPTTGFGSEFEIQTNLPSLSHAITQSSPLKLGLRSEVEDLVLHMFTLDLVSYISEFSRKVYTPPKLPESPFHGPPMFGHEGAPKSGWDIADDDDSEEEEPNPITQLTGVKPYNPYWKYQQSPLFRDVYLVPWSPSFSAGGELASYSPVRDRVRKMVVNVRKEEVGVKVRWMGKGTRGLVYDLGKKEERGKEEKFVWRAEGDGGVSGSLEEIVEGLGREVKEEETSAS